MLKSPRLSKLPSVLIYEFPNSHSATQSSQKVFSMISLERNEKAGFLACHKSNLNLRDDYKGNSLAIDFICVFRRNNGYGTKLLNFAKNLSKQIGCNGYIFLKSDTSFTPNRIPHLFYRKNGFTTLNSTTDEVFDKFIKKGKFATYQDFTSMNMFYPVQQETKETSFFETIITRINQIVKNILK